MKVSYFAFLVFVILGLGGGALWYVLRFGDDSAAIRVFLPEIVTAIFVALGFATMLFFAKYLKYVKQYQSTVRFSQKLQKKNTRYELIMKGVHDGIWDWNLETDKVFFSESWRIMLNFAPNADTPRENSLAGTVNREPLQNSSEWWASHIHPDDIEKVNQHLESYLNGSQSRYEVEYRIADGGGEYIWVVDRARGQKNTDGEYTRLAGMTTTIQDTKNVENVLKQRTSELQIAKNETEDARARIRAVLESIGEGVIAVDQRGYINIANPTASTLLGVSQEQMLEKPYTSAVPKEENRGEESISKDERAVYRTLATGEGHSGTFYYYNAEDEKFPVSVTSAPIELNGEESGAIVVFRDITKEMEIDKQKTEFVSLASHQLRTPLSAIRWYSEMVLSEKMGELSEKQHKYVEEIYTSNLRMIELVNSLLNVSRIEMGTFAVEPSEIDLYEMLESVVGELMPSIKEKDQTLVKDYEEAPREFRVDKNLMRIVFQNLLSNSVKYTQEEGTIKVSVHKHDDALRVEVADNGYGIPEKDQPHMFQKLYRADNVKIKDTEGTGLGLYIIKSVVEKTGGKIWFESTENKGTTFFVELPMSGMKKIEGTRGLEK